jgi:hypothetical protein
MVCPTPHSMSVNKDKMTRAEICTNVKQVYRADYGRSLVV